jgi:hypothetical protein
VMETDGFVCKFFVDDYVPTSKVLGWDVSRIWDWQETRRTEALLRSMHTDPAMAAAMARFRETRAIARSRRA